MASLCLSHSVGIASSLGLAGASQTSSSTAKEFHFSSHSCCAATSRFSSGFYSSVSKSYQKTWTRFMPVRSHAEAPQAINREACPKIKDQIAPEVFDSVDLRVGLIVDAKTVLDAEMSEKRGKPTMSRKYLLLKVDIGSETRTIVSECKYVMDMEDAIGKKVIFVANLPPTQIEGIESHGVILTGLNYDPTPMPRSFKVILPGLGRLPPGSQIIPSSIPR